ncbi:DUF448 domain-containing protein [Sandaracinobacter neustonicus]|uniref:DUF448 domain-containing protein n=1 Tax=Sandaracinobacter neustonicus TaxID=1715348 RepID=A0A501XDM2_9SPHN|nr:DUF448 domain-containing protein [Sandaracinobacter neustonicus]TPE58695.1 DUF448 domain-containing protein [Sandaracinobacter neustonicus]
MSSNDTPDATVEVDLPLGHTPERKCILTGVHGERASLIRLALGPDGAAWPDLAAKLPGRGAWIGVDKPALESALAKGKLKGALARAFRQPVEVPADLPQRIADGLERRALDRLGLEHRAGHLIFGSDKIAEWARAGRVYLLMHAADAADDGTSKLNQAFRVGSYDRNEGDMAEVLTLPAGRDALSRSLGRENIVHSGVTNGKAAARIATEVARWAAFLGNSNISNDGRGLPERRNDEGRE